MISMAPFSFAVVEECMKRLIAVGFSELKEKEPWKISPGGKVREIFSDYLCQCLCEIMEKINLLKIFNPAKFMLYGVVACCII